MAVDFTPTFKGYSGQDKFRFWCQKVLPLVYDDSLSYYEVLCKVITYLNNVIEDVADVEDNAQALLDAFNSLQAYVNTVADNLDEEIEQVFNEMVESGEIGVLVDEAIGDKLVPEYDPTDNYLAGDYVIEDGKVYRANSATTGTFDPTKWEQCYISEDLTLAFRMLSQKPNISDLWYNTPEMYGAVGDGVTDDTTAIQNAVTDITKVTVLNKKYLTSNKINIPAFKKIILYNAELIGSNANQPILAIEGNMSEIAIEGYNSHISGTAKYGIYTVGAGTNYVRDVFIKGLIFHGTFEADIYLDDHTRLVRIDKIYSDGTIGLYAHNKVLEVNIVQSVFTNTTCLQAISEEGYDGAEGIIIGECSLIGNINIRAINVFHFENSYIYGNITFNQLINFCHGIIINGCSIDNGQLIFGETGRTNAYDYQAIVSNTMFNNSLIRIKNNSYNININNCEFINVNSDNCITFDDNTGKLTFDNIKINNEANGIISNADIISDVSINNIVYFGNGTGIYVKSACAIHNTIGFTNDDQYGNITRINPTSYATDAELVSASFKVNKGDRGILIFHVEITGGTLAGDITLQVDPTNLTLPSGSGWNSRYFKAQSLPHTVDYVVPFVASATGVANVKLVNKNTNQISVGYFSWFSAQKISI